MVARLFHHLCRYIPDGAHRFFDGGGERKRLVQPQALAKLAGGGEQRARRHVDGMLRQTLIELHAIHHGG